MSGSLGLKIIHAIGYVATAIVFLELAGVGLLWSYWTYWGPQASRRREETRTHDRALSPKANILEAYAVRALEPLRPSSGGTEDGLTFVSMPSFSPWYAATIRLDRGAPAAQGLVVAVREDDETRKLSYSPVQPFTVPRAAYRAAAERLDALTDGWAGSGRGGCYDGVVVAFERTRPGRVTSGEGNASCDRHYGEVREVMDGLVSRFAPKLRPAPVPASAAPAG
jgi:hypothetical protein